VHTCLTGRNFTTICSLRQAATGTSVTVTGVVVVSMLALLLAITN
jgi:hypothetical protein